MRLTSFVIHIDPQTATAVENISLRSFTTTNAQGPNAIPMDISLSNYSVNQTNGVNATVGILTTTDPDGADTHTYLLVSGTGDTHNALFNLSGSTLRANNAGVLAAGNYSIRIQTDDGKGGTYEKAFSIMVVDSIAPTVSIGAPSVSSTSSGPVDYTVTYSGQSSISLNAGQITVNTTGSASASTVGVSGSDSTRTVTLSGITGNGTLGISLATGTASDSAGNNAAAAGPSTTFTVAPANAAPTDLALSSSTMNQSGGANATVGTLTTTDADGLDTHTYSLVSGTGDTNNASFAIETNTLKVAGSALAAGNYSIRIQTDDGKGGGTYAKAFEITSIDDVAPTVSDANISISGASGTGGAYKIGDTVTATWNNTAAGDNNSDIIVSVTVNFSQFGGGAAVAALNSSGIWTATYTITSGAIDASNRNVSVTATDNAGNATTRADTTNATVDRVAPTVSDANISISGASGTGGAYKIGDTVTATWNNTAAGDNNSDTIAGVTVNFSQFGGGAAVAAVNSFGIWTATYTITSGTIDASNRNVAVTAIDNAGNATTTVDTTNATVDNGIPVITSADSAEGTNGVSFSYNIVATGGATVFGAGELPTGLSVNSETGEISGQPTQAGTFNIEITASDAAGNTATQTLTLTLAKAQAEVSLANLSAIFDGAAKSATATTTPADLTVLLTYEGLTDAPTNAGSYQVIGTISDANHVGATTNTLVIAQAEATVTLAGLSHVFDGESKVVTATTEPADLAVVLTYNGSLEAPTNAGSYEVIGAIAEANYAGAATNTLVIAQAAASVSLAGLNQVFDGTSKEATASTEPPDLTVTLTYDGLNEAPTNAGSYEVIGTINEVNYAGATTNTLVIAPAEATVTLAGLNQVFDGLSKSATASTEPPDLAVALTYDGLNEAPTNAGSYTVVGTITEANYVGAATNILVITQASAEVTLVGLSQVFDGAAKAATASTEPADLAVILTYDGSTEAPTNAGSYEVIGTINELNYAGATTNTLVIAQAEATVTLTELSQIFDGAGKAATATTVPTDLIVVLTYNGSAEWPTNAGSYEVIATINEANHAGAATNTLVIHQAPADVTLAGLNQVFDGTSKAATATTDPADLAVVLTYDGSTEAPTNAGSYEVIGTIAESNYAGAATNTLVIAQAGATVSLAGLNQVFDGTSKAATATTEPADLTVTLTYDGLMEAPTNAGSYEVIGTIIEANYIGATTNTLVIAQASAEVTLAGLSQVFDGTAKVATATTAPSDLAVVLTYDGSTEAPTNAGSYEVIGMITEVNYAGAVTNTLVISAASAEVTLAGLSHVYDGTGKVASFATVPNGLNVVLAYNGSTEAPTNAGSYEVIGTINEANYIGATTNTLLITQASAEVTLGGLSTIFDGTAKSATATTTPADLTVLLTYEGMTDVPTNAGSYEVIGTISEANYVGAKTNTLVIAQAQATVTLTGLSHVFDGESKVAMATTEPADLTVVVTYNGSLEAPTNAGSYEVIGTINEANYIGATTNTLVISPAAATISLAGLNQVFDGTSKSATALTEPADLTVTLTYDGSTEPPTNAGSYEVVGTITEANYAGAATNTLVIAQAEATVTLAGLSQIFDGEGKAATATTEPADLTVILTYDGLTDAPTNAGSYEVIGTISDANYIGAKTNTLVIAEAEATVTLVGLNHVFDGESKVATATTEPANLAVILTYNGLAEAPTNAGSYEVIGTIAEANYAGAATNTLVIAQAEATVTLSGLSQMFDGEAKVVTATTVPSDLIVVLIYNGSVNAPTNAGSYEVIGTIADANYAGAATNTLVISLPAPVITLSAATSYYTLGDGVKPLDALANLSAPGSRPFAGGSLSVTIVSNPGSVDLLWFYDQESGTNRIAVSETEVSFDGTTIATYSGGVTGLASLQFSFTAQATEASIQELLRNVAFTLNREDSELSRVIEFTLTDGNGATAEPVSLTLVLNHRPSLGADRAVTGTNLPVQINYTRVLANDSDPDGDAFEIVAAADASLFGGTVVTNETGFFYSPALDFKGTDQFSYTVLDARGGFATQSVSVIVLSGGELAMEDVDKEPAAHDQSATVVFMGIPGRTYQIQGSENLIDWTAIGTLTPSESGLTKYYDGDATNHMYRFYRTVYP